MISVNEKYYVSRVPGMGVLKKNETVSMLF